MVSLVCAAIRPLSALVKLLSLDLLGGVDFMSFIVWLCFAKIPVSTPFIPASRPDIGSSTRDAAMVMCVVCNGASRPGVKARHQRKGSKLPTLHSSFSPPVKLLHSAQIRHALRAQVDDRW